MGISGRWEGGGGGGGGFLGDGKGEGGGGGRGEGDLWETGKGEPLGMEVKIGLGVWLCKISTDFFRDHHHSD